MAKIRIVRGVLNDTDNIDPALWRAQINLGLPVGLCDCGGSADGEPIGRGRLAWANARCVQCGAEACRPVIAGVAPLPA